MHRTTTVKVSKRNQIVVPAIARERLRIQSGDRLLVDIQDGMMILIPQPENYTQHLTGLHKEVWEGVDPREAIDEERSAWDDSLND